MTFYHRFHPPTSNPYYVFSKLNCCFLGIEKAEGCWWGGGLMPASIIRHTSRWRPDIVGWGRALYTWVGVRKHACRRDNPVIPRQARGETRGAHKPCTIPLQWGNRRMGFWRSQRYVKSYCQLTNTKQQWMKAKNRILTHNNMSHCHCLFLIFHFSVSLWEIKFM